MDIDVLGEWRRSRSMRRFPFFLFLRIFGRCTADVEGWVEGWAEVCKILDVQGNFERVFLAVAPFLFFFGRGLMGLMAATRTMGGRMLSMVTAWTMSRVTIATSSPTRRPGIMLSWSRREVRRRVSLVTRRDRPPILTSERLAWGQIMGCAIRIMILIRCSPMRRCSVMRRRGLTLCFIHPKRLRGMI